MNEWVSIKDKLPPMFLNPSVHTDPYLTTDYLVTDGKTIVICEYQEGQKPEYWREFGDYSGIPRDLITHWMALPELPTDN